MNAKQEWHTTAEMCVDAHVSSRSSQTLVLTIRNVLVRFRVHVFLGETEVNDVDDVVPVVWMSANQEILRLHISEDQTLGMHVLHSTYLTTTDTVAFSYRDLLDWDFLHPARSGCGRISAGVFGRNQNVWWLLHCSACWRCARSCKTCVQNCSVLCQ